MQRADSFNTDLPDLSLINNLSAENYLSRLAGLLRTVISWSLKTVLGLTLGLNLIQSLVLPAFDSFKGSLLMRLSSAIPGIGNAMNAAARAAIGSGVLLECHWCRRCDRTAYFMRLASFKAGCHCPYVQSC